MKLNFFDWIREGVRQSVLLGLADAASEIGSPEEADDLNQQFLSRIEQGRIGIDAQLDGHGRRKVLGRSLTQLANDG